MIVGFVESWSICTIPEKTTEKYFEQYSKKVNWELFKAINLYQNFGWKSIKVILQFDPHNSLGEGISNSNCR